ncbi:MAG: hypothetical protein GWP16_04005 [Nitrospirae bacterium]|nr:hypothetical protein [Nitrospirota bacterium]
MLKRVLTFLGLVALTLVLAHLVSAQDQLFPDTPHLDRLEVVIWPEYDQPAALVMLRAHLAQGTPLPAVVPLPMPADVAAPNAVAQRGSDGTLLMANYTRQDSEVGSWILIETNSMEVRLEYYTALPMEGGKRQFTYQWPGGLDLHAVVYEVQQPAGATSFTITPPQMGQQISGDGLTYYFAELGAKQPTDSFIVELSYDKADQSLSIASLSPALPSPSQLPPPTATPATAPPDSGTSVWLIVAPIVIGMGLIILWLAIKDSKKS